MNEQHLLSEGLLLNEDGDLLEAGYAYSLVKHYERKMVKASPWRIKEWDYYYIGNDSYGIALTIDDNGYMDLCSVTLLDYEHARYLEKMVVHPFSFGKRNLPFSSTNGDTVYLDKKVTMKFLHEGDIRHIVCVFPKFGKKGEELKVDITLKETNGKSMVIATPFKKKAHFYYNQKINNLEVHGYVKLGEKYFDFSKDCYGVLDWGRGVWTYSNTWYWSSLSGKIGEDTIGWNLGYGFGDTSAASENMLFVNDKAYKLDDVTFSIPKKKKKDDFLSPWSVTSSNGDINLTFTPILDRHGGANLLIMKSDQHQVFGKWNGYFIVEDKKIEIIDKLGFAEKVANRW